MLVCRPVTTILLLLPSRVVRSTVQVLGNTTPAAGTFTTPSASALILGGVTGSAYVPSAVAITGGSINSTVIGNTTPAAGTFTNLTTTGNITPSAINLANATGLPSSGLPATASFSGTLPTAAIGSAATPVPGTSYFTNLTSTGTLLSSGTLSATGTVVGAGLTNFVAAIVASPTAAIGSAATPVPGTSYFTSLTSSGTLTSTGTVSGAGFTNFVSGTTFTALTSSGTISAGTTISAPHILVGATPVLTSAVTSVGLSLPLYTAFAAITTSGTFTGTLASVTPAPTTQAWVLASPAGGAAGTPAFRAMVVSDLPAGLPSA